MTGGAGGRAGADVVIVAEQLRRRVPGGIGTYVSGLLAGLSGQARTRGLGVSLVASRTPPPDPLERFGFPIRALRVPPRLIAKAWDLGLCRVHSGGLVHATSFAMPPTTAKLVVTVHDLAFLSHPDAYPGRGLRWHRDALHRSIERASAFVVPAPLPRPAAPAAPRGESRRRRSPRARRDRRSRAWRTGTPPARSV